MKAVLSAVAALMLTSNVVANACTFDVEVGDNLQFSVASIKVPSECKEVTINLSHTGKMEKAAMGHNWVLSKESDLTAIANAGLAAGLGNDYLPSGDARVIAATSMIGGGESTSVTFSVEGLSGSGYMFFCSFPGHWAVMKGTFELG